MFNRRSLEFFTLIIGVCFLFYCPPMTARTGSAAQGAAVQGPVISDIAAKYKDKFVLLPRPFCGETLQFDASARLVSSPIRGTAELCQGLRIRDVRIENNTLKITAQRVRAFYDCHTKQIGITGANKGTQSDIGNQGVFIEAELPEHHDERAATALMAELFRPPEAGFSLPGGIFHVGSGVTAPILIYGPDPDYSEQALKAKYEGTVVLTVVIGPDGLVRNAAVYRSLGMGLDEKAIEKVKTWLFKPAALCGTAVPVEVSVEIDFKMAYRH